MSGRRAFLVIGPESSGTRLVTEGLIACGCAGSHLHAQPFDPPGGSLDGAGDLIVWRRSLPHGWREDRRMPNLDAELLEPCRSRGYRVRVFIANRDPFCMARSQVIHPHVRTLTEANANIATAQRIAEDFVTRNRLPVQRVQYETIVANPNALRQTFQTWGLDVTPGSTFPVIRDGNRRYHAEQLPDTDYEGMSAILNVLLDDPAPVALDEISRRAGMRSHDVERLGARLVRWNKIVMDAAGFSLRPGTD